MTVKHIDNNFFKLTPAQAKKLSIENRLPRPGHAIRANPELVKTLSLEYRGKVEPLATERLYGEAWIQLTPLRWFDGKDIPSGWTCALHLHFKSL